MYNNLFYYATGELSQDAFICWLMSFAVKGCDKNPALRECAEDFLRQFVGVESDAEVWLSKEPERQYKHIDVLLTVNDKYKVIIEDKTYTSQHDNQLINYKNTVKEDFRGYECCGVYFKTGFQSNTTEVDNAGYRYFDRKAIFNILSKHTERIQNDIFQDYYAVLKNLNDTACSYRTTPVAQWDRSQINEFYSHCQATLSDTKMKFGYGYVHNQSGGFYGMWIYHDQCFVTIQGITYELYLQCEYANPEFKIRYRASASDEKIYGERRDQLIWRKEDGKWKDVAKEYHFTKPERYGSGKSVALGDYNVTIETAQEAESAIVRAIEDFKRLVNEIAEKTIFE